MKILYDPHTDTLNVILRDNVAVHESDEDKPGVILDYDKEGNLISLEILDARNESRIRARSIFSWLNDRWPPGAKSLDRENYAKEVRQPG